MFNLVIIEGYVGLCSRHELLEIVPRHDTTPTSTLASSLITIQPHTKSKYPNEKITVKQCTTHIKSKEYVDDSPDELRDEGSQVVETAERGWSSMQIDKGKGKRKERSKESQESGRIVLKTELMDLDMDMDELANDQSSPSSPSQLKQMPTKSSMKPGTTMSQGVN